MERQLFSARQQFPDLVITIRDKDMAYATMKLLGNLAIEPGKVKLYATEKTSRSPLSIELTLEHQKRIWQGQWTSFSDLAIAGFRFFGVETEGKVVTPVGLWPHTHNHVEIIMVGTVPEYMRRGYAKAACSHALNTGLDSADVVTWSMDISNTPSRELARSLGFMEYLTTFHLKRG